MKALELRFDGHWIREDLTTFEERSKGNPKAFPPMKDRIFQGSYAPILHRDKIGKIGVSPMRYGVYQPSFIKDPKIAKAFNARRDNLTAPYWSEAFEKHHGFVVLNGFYEWVGVSDLIKAGVVSIKDVKAQFAKESLERKERILASGKKYAETATEKKDPRFRKIIIKFQPKDESDLYVPVVYTTKKLEGGAYDYGFAIVTDDPQHEVLAAGHDRSPAFVTQDAVLDWIDIKGKSTGDLQNVLDQKPPKYFEHALLAV
ncbi:MAG: SOS response-associated peptidase family protein [Chitinophagaceae bacterium]|nr:SOS response-associated peptidase family protein [Oligoflexus sp.]